MKKREVLVLSSGLYSYLPAFVQEGKRLGVAVDCRMFDEVRVSYAPSGVVITVKGKRLERYRLIYIRTSNRYDELQMLVVEYCRLHTITVIDRARRFNRPWIDTKGFEYLRLASVGVPVIQSILVSEQSLPGVLNSITFPCVVKRTDMDRGKGVFLCKTERALCKRFSIETKHLLVQPFIPNDGDIRVLVVGGKVVGSTLRKSSDPSEFRSNASLGGTVSAYRATGEQENIAVRAAEALEYDTAGVDLIYDKQTAGGRYWKSIFLRSLPHLKRQPV